VAETKSCSYTYLCSQGDLLDYMWDLKLQVI
jgi:hypothetical protein